MKNYLSLVVASLLLGSPSLMAQTTTGKINFAKDQGIAQRDITVKYLGEARNFSRSDAPITKTSYSRFGILAAPWQYTKNILNQNSGTAGGFDSYNNLNAISIEHWNANSAAFVNAKIWQNSTLPAGDYKLSVANCTAWDLAQDNLVYLCINKGDTLNNVENISKDLAYKDFNSQPREITFSLTEDTKVAWGFVANVPYETGGMSMRVTDFKLCKMVNGEEGDDVSSLLGSYTNIQRADPPTTTTKYTRYGKPTNWVVENYSIDMGGDGMNQGIDKYIGVNELGMDQWYNNYVGTDSKIYKKISLPAGKYAFNAYLTSMYGLESKTTYQFASTVLPTVDNITTLSKDVCSYACLSDYNTGSGNVGLEFTLTQPSDVYLGWCGSFVEGNYEVRVSDVQLVRAVDAANGLLADDSEALSSNTGQLDLPVNLWGDKGTYQGYEKSCLLAYPNAQSNTCYLIDWCTRAAVVGDVNFEQGKYDIAYLTCAYTGKDNGNGNTETYPDPSIDLYLDSEQDLRGDDKNTIDVTPLVSFKNLEVATADTNFVTYKVSIPDYEFIEGVHKVTVKQNGYGAYIYNIGFTSTTGVKGISDDKGQNTMIVESTGNNLLVSGVKKGIVVNVYSLTGAKVSSFVSNGIQNIVKINKGLYIISDGSSKVKRIVVK